MAHEVRAGATKTAVTLARETVKTVQDVLGTAGTHIYPNPCSWTRPFPSPRPSPSGRGRTVWQSQKKSPSSEAENRSTKAPSPWGEGRGEGDRDVRTAWIGLKRGVNETRKFCLVIIHSRFLERGNRKGFKSLREVFRPCGHEQIGRA